MTRCFALFFSAVLLTSPFLWAEVKIESNTFAGLRARALGPAVMSGRIAAIDAVPGNPLTIYAGTASGGVWKSKNSGTTWIPVFDDHNQSIGAVKVDPANSDVVWVGTGESWVRNSVSVGDGVYKSTNAGESWTRMGLEDSERIADILVDPKQGDTVFVCATGQLWKANEERGVFKTTDGGKSWKKVLYVDENTGCSDLAMDPQNPDILFAGMWEFRRYPDFFTSGGPGSGLYRSTDGGENWTELTAGFPESDKGRIAVETAPSRASRVYALIESENTALYRSDDLGASWEEMNTSFSVRGRPFYFSLLVVDPSDYDRLYKPGLFLALSTDGGKAFSSIFSALGAVHPDHHALWINPENPHHLILGTDGGVYISNDRGTNFNHVRGLPLAQFYEASYDMEWPYNVYGGLQDNGTWTAPSRKVGGIRNSDWKNLGYGDGFHAYRDPVEPDVIYVEYQGGRLLRHWLPTGEIKQIAPLEQEGDPEFRFNWNTPLHLSRSQPGTIYYGSQFLFRSKDRGESWERISPDLTTNDPERQRQQASGGLTIDNSTAENNATIYTISESPLNGELIWVGTDDGRVQVTRDGGRNWTDVGAAIPELPEGSWISHVEASPHSEGTAFVTVDNHASGDMNTYLFLTADYGQSWRSIVGEGLEGFVHVAIQDPVNPDLLFAGTEFGLFITLDLGMNWARFTGDLPKVPVRDLDIHAREHDLIIATHGRGIYILDDLTPMRALTQEIVESSFALLPSRDSVMFLSADLQDFPGDDLFIASNPPEAASIFFYQKRRHIFGDLKIEIYDSEGEVVSTIQAPKIRGLNRAEWPMRMPAPKLPPATNLSRAMTGPRVPEGEYRFKVFKGKETFEGTLRLVPDPRSTHSTEDRAIQQRTALKLYEMLEDLTYYVDASIDLRTQAEKILEGRGEEDALVPLAKQLIDEIEAYRGGLVSTAAAGMLSGDEKLREKLGEIFSGISSYDGRPTQSQLDRTEVLGGQLETAAQDFRAMLSGDSLRALNEQLEAAETSPLTPLGREAWQAQSGESGAGGPGFSLRQVENGFRSPWF